MSDMGLAQQLLNRLAEVGLLTQLDATDRLAVDVQTNPLKLATGEVDSVAIAGTGITLQPGIHVQELELETNSISIDLASAVSGKIELDQATQAKLKVVLTEADLNDAINSSYIREQLKKLDFYVDGKLTNIESSQLHCHLPEDNRIVISGEALFHSVDKNLPAAFLLEMCISDNRQRVILERGHYLKGKELPIEYTLAFFNTLSQLIKQPSYKFKDILICIDELILETGQAQLLARVSFKQVPSL